MMEIGRNTERGTAMIVTGNFVWIITCRFVRGRGWMMFLRLVFVSFAPLSCGIMGRLGLLVGIDGKCVGNLMADIGDAERDSRKDEAVVFIFIFATAGLLIWAAIRPWVGKWVDVSCMYGTLRLGTTADWFGFIECKRAKELYTGVDAG